MHACERRHQASKPGHLDFDGEEVPFKPTTVKVRPGMARIMGSCTRPVGPGSEGATLGLTGPDAGVVVAQPDAQNLGGAKPIGGVLRIAAV